MRRSLLALPAVAAMALLASGQDEDPVKAKLDKAKAAYAADAKKFRDEVGSLFDKREEAARKDGNKKLLDQIKDERKAFEEREELPTSTPKAVRQKLGAARSSLEKAFDTAVKEYTKGKKDAEAAAVEKELDEFRKTPDPSDTRRRWVHAKGEFASLGGGAWEEKGADGNTYKWKETARTKDFVELQANIFGVDYTARLGAKSADYKSGKENFKPKFSGKWAD